MKNLRKRISKYFNFNFLTMTKKEKQFVLELARDLYKTPDSLSAKKAFDVAEFFLKEAKKRGYFEEEEDYPDINNLEVGKHITYT